MHKRLTMIWRFIVKKVRTKKYITKIGQKTGTSKISKNVRKKAINVDFMVLSLKKPVNLNKVFKNKPEFEFG